MTRGELEKLENTWSTFTGEFVKYGRLKRKKHTTVLLKNICHNGVVVADHVWFATTKDFDAVGTLYEGEIVKFTARVEWYQQGYIGDSLRKRRIDYRLWSPTKIEVIEERMILNMEGITEGVN